MGHALKYTPCKVGLLFRVKQNWGLDVKLVKNTSLKCLFVI